MNKANYITVTEFKEYNPELDFTNYSDATLSGVITRASQTVDNFLQYSLSIESISNEKNEATVSSNGNLIIYSRKLPIISVSAVTIKLGTVNLNLTLTDGAGNQNYDIPSRGSYVIFPYQQMQITGTFSIRNFYQMRGLQLFSVMSYVAGYDTIPADIKDAVNLFAKDIFIRQANPMDLSSTTQGAISMGFRGKNDYGESSLIKQGKSILQSYRRVTT